MAMLAVNPFTPLSARMDGLGGIACVRAIFVKLDEGAPWVALTRRLFRGLGGALPQLARGSEFSLVHVADALELTLVHLGNHS